MDRVRRRRHHHVLPGEDPLPPKMPRFRVARTLSPSAPEIVPFWGSGGGRFRPRGSGQRFFELEEASLAGLVDVLGHDRGAERL